MALNPIAFIKKRKTMFITIAIGVFLGFIFNPQLFPQKDAASNPPLPKEHKIDLNPSSPLRITRIAKNVKIVNTYERGDRLYYTQGLAFKDPHTIIESTGMYGDSFIQYLDAKTMKVTHSQPLDAKYFGEGCEFVTRNGEEEIYQLTWKERDVLVWDAKDLSLKRKIELPKPIREGWGLAKRFEKDENGKEVLNFYVTDGTNKVYVVDGETWQIKRTIEVRTIEGQVIRWINELEFVHGKLWANVYFAESIVVIDIETGVVDTRVDLTQLRKLAMDKMTSMKKKFQEDYVLNGIAYDEANDKMLVTGKNWPLIWEIKVGDVY